MRIGDLLGEAQMGQMRWVECSTEEPDSLMVVSEERSCVRHATFYIYQEGFKIRIVVNSSGPITAREA